MGILFGLFFIIAGSGLGIMMGKVTRRNGDIGWMIFFIICAVILIFTGIMTIVTYILR